MTSPYPQPPEPPALPAAESPPDAPSASAGEGRRGDAADQEAGSSSTPPRQRRAPLKWAQLLRRVFSIDVLRCPRCSTAMVILALISDPPVITKILRHLGLSTEPPPLSPARASWETPPFALSPPPDDPALCDPVIITSRDDTASTSPAAMTPQPEAARPPP